MTDRFFISDLHLTRASLKSQEAFGELCHWLSKRQATQLYILGDFFQFWLNCPKFIEDNYQPVLTHLRQLSDSGIAIHFFLGNHDFLLRSARNLPQNLIIHIKGEILSLGKRRYYITHGDDLCRSDYGYRATKPFLRSRVLEFFFNRLPGRYQEKIAQTLSASSQQMVEMKSEHTLKITIRHCQKIIARHSLDGIVYGHVHKNGLQPIEVEGRSARLLSVGPWEGGAHPVWRYCEAEDRWEEIKETVWRT